MSMGKRKGRYVLCVQSGTYRASLEARKVYRVVDDPASESKALLRVVDESGEDYLYPADLFVPIEVPEEAAPAFAAEASGAR
jgi:hypothetical protein